MSQKQDRALKFVDEVKTLLTHKLPEKSRRDFAVKIGHYQAEIRDEPESHLPGIQARFDKWIKSELKNVPGETADEVKGALWRLDLAINGRR